MRKYWLLVFMCITSFGIKAQNSEFKNGFGINQDFHDYNVRLLDRKLTSFDSSLSQSIRVSYTRYLSRTWAVSTGFSNGFLLNQTEENRLIRKSYMFGGDIDLLFKLNNGTLLKSDAAVAPYLSFGYNFNYLTAHKKIGLAPLMVSNEYGLGFNIRLGSKSSIQAMLALDQQLNGDFDTHMQYRLGFAQSISRSKETEKPKKEEKPLDYDNDGIADADDNCPTLPGVSANNGCPENWAESGENKYYRDSMLARLDELDQMILELMTDVHRLSQDRIVEVECKEDEGSSSGKSVVTQKEPATEKKEVAENNTKEKKAGEKHEDAVDKTETDSKKDTGKEEVARKDDNVAPDQTRKDDPKAKDEIVRSKPNPDQPQQKEVGTSDGLDPMADYVRESGPKAYYVVVISTKDMDLARRTADLVSNDYPVVKILSQPNGYNRVGIYATKSKGEALKVLEYVKNHGVPSAWISYE